MREKLVLSALVAPFMALDLFSNLSILNPELFTKFMGLWGEGQMFVQQNLTWFAVAACGLVALFGAMAASKDESATQK